MTLSIGFSVVFYRTSWHELGRQMPPPYAEERHRPGDFDFGGFLQDRVAEGRDDLLEKLVLLNIAALAVGSVISYILARRTLLPIEEAMEMQSRFASDASHELRTPLAIIQAENEVALRSKDLTLGHAKDLLRSNLEESVKLKELSEGLLRLAQKDQGLAETEPVSLVDVASDAINHIVKAAQEKTIDIVDETPNISVVAERQQLTHAVTILLDNAVKYSDAKSSVHVAGHNKGKFGYLTVRDEGIGIPDDALGHIFDRFYRVDSSRAKKHRDGYGLGLSIAHKIVQQLGGEITVESALGKGSTFTIKLPLAQVS